MLFQWGDPYIRDPGCVTSIFAELCLSISLDKLPLPLLASLNVDERETETEEEGRARKERGKVCAVVLLSIGLFQKSSPEQVLVGGRDKDQLASFIHR